MSEVQATKCCPTCKTTKMVGEFGRDKSNKDGRFYECKACLSERTKRRGDTPRGDLLNRWRAIKSRCEDSRNANYRYYGGRGIRLCPEWHDFAAFKTWALANGYQKNLEIDRINNDGNYEPRNCRFVTHTQNARNTRSRAGSNSKYIGVHQRKVNGRWRAYVCDNGKMISVGEYDTEEEAARARDAVAVPMGFRANLPCAAQ